MKTAVILFNLGGPDSPEAVRPFLQNLFSDPAIIRVPSPIRQMLAWLIAKRRTPEAQEIYHELGGGSPILPNTLRQAEALKGILGPDFEIFPVMRYWHPRARDVVADLKRGSYDRVVLLPLYPQFSTTTTQSSYDEWIMEAKRQGLDIPTFSVGCYPDLRGFVDAQAELLSESLKKVPTNQPFRVLFSAHGLPQRVVDAGDPYAIHVLKGATLIAEKAGLKPHQWRVSYQSKVGPLKWLEPATDAEIQRAAEEGLGIVIVPLAFVSEHSETLVELDIQYAELAQEVGLPFYQRVATVSDHPRFIAGLAELVKGALAHRFLPQVPHCDANQAQCLCRRMVG
ncbi:MAG: ferrochelatase [Holosporales bacterium]